MTDTALLDHPAIEIKTDREFYNVATHEGVAFSIRNISSSPVYFSTCFPESRLNRLEEGKTVETLGLYSCECICGTELAANEVWSDTLLLSGNTYEGIYQIFLPVYSNVRWSMMLDDYYLHSNQFVVFK